MILFPTISHIIDDAQSMRVDRSENISKFDARDEAVSILISNANSIFGVSHLLCLEVDSEGCSGSEGEDDRFHLVVEFVFFIR